MGYTDCPCAGGGVINIPPDYLIDFANSDIERRSAILACDSAFKEHPIGLRPEFYEIMKKLNLKGHVLVAYKNQEILGYSAFYANDISREMAYITLFAVKPTVQRMHIGSRLMEMTCNFAAITGHRYMALEVHQDNAEAIAFYTKQGFAVFEENEISCHMKKLIVPPGLD